FVDSSHVYQGMLGGQDAEWIDALNEHTVARQPDQVFIFDLPVSIAVQRMGQRIHSDRFDRQSLDNLERLRLAYQARAQVRHRRLIDASLSEDVLAQSLSDEIMSFLQ
ncbi:MAG: dTMP kinase, partial [Oceanococcus sp.]